MLSNINSVLLGARKTNPDATVQVIFTGEWSLPVREAEATNALVDAGCDVITCHVDSPKVVIQTAESRGVKTCGHNASQAPLAPKGFITGAEYKWSTIYNEYAKTLAAGGTLPNFLTGGYDLDYVQNTPYGAGATPEAIKAADAAKVEMKAKKAYYVGPLKDNTRQGSDPGGRPSTRPTIRGSTASTSSPRASSARSPEPSPLSGGRGPSSPPAAGFSVKSAAGGAGIAVTATTPTEVEAAPSIVPAADIMGRIARSAEAVIIPALAVLVAAALFSIFLVLLGKSPVTFFSLLWRGGFGTSFSWQNTLVRAAPLILTALCVAVPARLGMVIIGGEGAFVLGGFAAAAAAIPFLGWAPPVLVMPIMVLTALLTGAVWIGFVGVLRHYRGVNETISSLLLYYIAVAIMNFFVDGALRDPTNPNKPSTKPIGDANMVGNIPGTEVHWGLVAGIVLAIALWVLMNRTKFGFAARITGGNVRAARAQGLPVGRLVVISCAIAGACAGLAGYFEVAAVQGRANASIAAGYGFTGILVAFLAKQNPLAIIPVSIFLGGIAAAGGLIQRRMGLPDATVSVLQGLMFVVLLVSDTFYGRFKFFRSKDSTQ